jgi:hypothetical protein
VTDPLSLDRFQELAEAYGGVIARWPLEYRDAALRTAATPAATKVIADALALDETLDAWRLAALDTSLGDRILVGAPAPSRSLAVRERFWWSGVCIAATLAGTVAGAAVVAVITPVDVSSDSATSFGDVAPQEG